MWFQHRFSVSVRCSECGKKLNAVEGLNYRDYDFVLEVEPHTCEPANNASTPTDGGLALRACVNASCGWVGKESACLTWKHAGDERMCPHCHDNTESIPLSAISG